ncbi:MAG: hypothetical protein KIT14_16080 [bacterium]|nr:hypothetical protein [bacterium]
MPWSLEALVRLARGALVALPGGSPWAVPEVEPAWAHRQADALGFEVRLTAGDDRLDVAFLVSASAACRESWTGLSAVDGGLADFFTAWADPASVLHAHVGQAWLEFDQRRDGRWPGPPFVTFALDAGLAPGAGPRSHARLGDLVKAGLTALVGPGGRDVVPSIRAAVGMLPDGGRLAHLAAMPHRGSSGARAVFAVPGESVPGFLRRLGWPGDAAVIEQALGEAWPESDRVSLNLDFLPAVGPRVGVELFRPTAPLDDPAWTPLLSMLERRGLCAPAKRAVLAAWPARHPQDARRGGRLERYVLVKLVFDPQRLIEAKAYLSAAPHLNLMG